MSTEDTSGVHVWLILMKAHQALQQQAEHSIHRAGLCFSDFTALEVLLHKGPIPINIIGEKLLLTSGSLTAAMDRLAKKGLVERHFSPTDRRIRIISLTAKGTELIETLFAQHSLDMEAALTGLNPEERRQLVQLLKQAGKSA